MRLLSFVSVLSLLASPLLAVIQTNEIEENSHPSSPSLHLNFIKDTNNNAQPNAQPNAQMIFKIEVPQLCFFGGLPVDLIKEIYSYLPMRDKMSFYFVNKWVSQSIREDITRDVSALKAQEDKNVAPGGGDRRRSAEP